MTATERARQRTHWVRAYGAAIVLALALLAQPRHAEARMACAPYVSGGPNNPASGALIGSMTVEECAAVRGGTSGTGASYEQCITYEVGFYSFGSYSERLDCRDYSIWG